MLVLPLVIPWLTGVALAAMDGRRRSAQILAAAGLGGNIVAVIWLAAAVLRQGPQTMVTGGWPPGIGIRLHADPLGVVFAVLSSGVLLAAFLHEASGGVRFRSFPALVLLLAAGLTGLFLTGDVFNFYVFFEISMVSAYVLTGYGTQARRARASLTFVAVNLLGSILFLGGIAGLYRITGTLDMAQVEARVTADPSVAILIAAIIFAAFGIKLGLFPFHYWVPAVYRDVRPVVVAILTGALANIGSYGLLRFGADLFPQQLAHGDTVLLILGTASILYGAALAVSRRLTAEVLAYSTISDAGYVLLGLGIGGPAGFTAAVLYGVVNALNKSLLFLSASLRGALVGIAFVIGALSVAGVPPSAGFLGKAALFRAGAGADMTTLLALIVLGSALSFVYMFRIYQLRFWVRQTPEPPSPLSARLLVLTMAGVVVTLGLWPEPLLFLSQRAADVLTAGGTA